MIFIGIVVSILLFTLIVIIHELGHFGAARFFGVKVEEFGIGIPPRAKELFRDKKGTLFSLNWLPIGGFVRLKGENINTLKNKNDRDALINISPYKQAIIILGGVFMNFLLAGIIFSLLFLVGVKPIGINTKIETQRDIKIIPTYSQAIEEGFLIKKPGVVLSPLEGSRAEKAGIKTGDIVESINGQIISKPKDMIEIISQNKENFITMKLKGQDDQTREISLSPSEEGQIGAYVSENIHIDENFLYKYPLGSAIKNGFQETYNQSLLTFQGLGMLLKNIFAPETPVERKEALAQVSGPIGIVDFISNSIRAGIIFILIIGAIISINLGVFNLLPIPALDGGRFVFIVINGTLKKIFGKKIINEYTENIIHVLFFLLLIALSVIIMYNDITKIINR